MPRTAATTTTSPSGTAHGAEPGGILGDTDHRSDSRHRHLPQQHPRLRRCRHPALGAERPSIFTAPCEPPRRLARRFFYFFNSSAGVKLWIGGCTKFAKWPQLARAYK